MSTQARSCWFHVVGFLVALFQEGIGNLVVDVLLPRLEDVQSSGSPAPARALGSSRLS
jgi:hypothetical protein